MLQWLLLWWPRIAQSLQRLATGRTVWVLNPSGGEIFGTRPDWPGAHPASCTMHWVSSPFPGGKLSRRDVDHSAPSSEIVKERVVLYLYSPLCLRGLFLGKLYLNCVCGLLIQFWTRRLIFLKLSILPHRQSGPLIFSSVLSTI